MAGQFTASRTRLAGLDLDRLPEQQVVARIIDALAAGQGGWVAAANIDVCRMARRDPALARLTSTASLLVPDGMPLVWAARLRGEPVAERVTGASLIFSLTKAAARHSRSIYLLGGASGVPDEAGRVLKERYPDLKVAGADSPPMGFDAMPGEIEAAADKMTLAAPDIVYVGLGFPKQERMIARFAPLLPSAWFIACGAAIPFVAGAVPRAPEWMQQAGLEWAFRMVSEPRRLVPRYVVHDLPFAAGLFAAIAWKRWGPPAIRR